MARKYNLYEGETIPSGGLEMDEAGYPIGPQPSNSSGLKNLYSGVKSAFAPSEGYSPDWETTPMEYGQTSYQEDRTIPAQGVDLIANMVSPGMLSDATRINPKRDPNPSKYNVEKSFGLLPNAEQYGLKLKRDGMPDTSLPPQTPQPQSQQDLVSNAVSPQTQKPGFFDWFKNMPPEKKLALLSAGLSLMSAAGRSYDRPIGAGALIGDAGQQGLGMYQNIDRYNQDMGMRNAYLGFAKQAADQSQATFGSKQPYLLEQAMRENEIQKAQLNNARNPEQKVINFGEYGTGMVDRFGNVRTIATPNARGVTSEKEYKNHVARQKEIISRVVPNEADFFAKLFELKDSAQKEALIAANPSTIEKLKKELEKPENAKYKAQWLISEKYTDEYLYGQGGGVNAGSNLPQTTSGKQTQPILPKEITTRSQAVSFLKAKHGMTDNQALQWIEAND